MQTFFSCRLAAPVVLPLHDQDDNVARMIGRIGGGGWQVVQQHIPHAVPLAGQSNHAGHGRAQDGIPDLGGGASPIRCRECAIPTDRTPAFTQRETA